MSTTQNSTEAVRRQGPQKIFLVSQGPENFFAFRWRSTLDPAPPPHRWKSTEIAAADFGKADIFYFGRVSL